MFTGGRWGAGVALVMLAACAEQAAPIDASGRPVEAPARIEPTAVATGEFHRGEATVREAVLPGDGVPATFAALHQRWHEDPATVTELVFTRADCERLFVSRQIACDAYGASHRFIDLDGDGTEELLVVVGKGWWEDGYDLHSFTAIGGGLRLTTSQRVAASGRYPPGLRQLDGDRSSFFCASRTRGTGTGICVSSEQLFEFVDGRPVEVLSLLGSAEYAPFGIGPSFTIRTRSFVIGRDPTSPGLVARSTLFVDVFSDLGEEFGRFEVEFELEFRQGTAGGRMLLQRPIGWRSEDLELNRLCVFGLRAWFERYEAPALRLAAAGTTQQQKFLLRAASWVRRSGAHRVADAVMARLPAADKKAR